MPARAPGAGVVAVLLLTAACGGSTSETPDAASTANDASSDAHTDSVTLDGQSPESAGSDGPSTTCGSASQTANCPLPDGGTGSCCSGTCVDPWWDSHNCDGCGLVCPAGSICDHSSCLEPDGGMAGCEGPGACPAGEFCYLGYYCAPLVCAFAGESACTNFGGGSGMWSQGLGACCSAGDGGCPDLTTDPHNCGGCGVVCASGVCTPDPSHTTGQCFPATAGTGCSGQSGCSNGLACVDGYCVAPRCVSGPMPPGSLLCAATGDQLGYCCDAHGHPQNNFCANLQTDPAHCGGCDSACMSGQSCVQGRCS